MDGDKIPIIRDDDKELLGFITKEGASWDAQTIFGYSIERVQDRHAAERVVRERGLNFLTGLWQYFDQDDQEWHSCVLKEAHERQVTVVRTTPMGFQDPENYKLVVIKNPSETNLIKA